MKLKRLTTPLAIIGDRTPSVFNEGGIKGPFDLVLTKSQGGESSLYYVPVTPFGDGSGFDLNPYRDTVKVGWVFGGASAGRAFGKDVMEYEDDPVYFKKRRTKFRKGSRSVKIVRKR